MVDVQRFPGTFNFGEQTSPGDLPPFPGDPDARPPDESKRVVVNRQPDLVSIQAPETAQFPEQWKEDYTGLQFLGYLEDVVDNIPFHSFIVRTLTVGEKIEIHRIVRDLEGMLGFNRAYKAAVVAAGLVMVDGQPIFSSQKRKAAVREKYEYVISEWHDIVIDILYGKIDALELRAVQVAYELGMVQAPPGILMNAAVEQELEDEAEK